MREVVLEGETVAEAQMRAEALARERGLTWVHPYDDPLVIAGQGTIALEMLEEAPDLDMLVIPVGGGGLIAGNAVAARAVEPAIEIVGAEAELYPSFWNALHGQNRPCGGPTLAEGIAVKNVGFSRSRSCASWCPRSCSSMRRILSGRSMRISPCRRPWLKEPALPALLPCWSSQKNSAAAG